MRRIFIAAPTPTQKQTDFANSGIDGVTSSDISNVKQYKNGNIGYKGKIYESVTLKDCKKQLSKIIFEKFKPGLDKINSTQLFKLFLEKDSQKQTIDLIKNIVNKIVDTPDALKNIIDGTRVNDTVFFARGKDEQQSQVNDDDELQQIQAILQESKQNLVNKYKDIVKTFKSSAKDDAALTTATNELQAAIDQIINEYNAQIDQMNQKYTTTKNQAFKELQKATEELVQKIQNSKDSEIEKLVQKLKKLKSKFETLKIDGKDEKIQTIEKVKGGQLVKLLNSGTYSLIKLDGSDYKTVTKDIKDLNQSNYIKYDDIGFIRVVSNGTKYVVNMNNFDDKKENAFIVDLSSLNEDFAADNFIINQNGQYHIYNRSSRSDIKTCGSVKELKDYIRTNYESSSPSPSSSSSSSTGSSFDSAHYIGLSKSDKTTYLNTNFPTGDIQIKKDDFNSLSTEDQLKLVSSLKDKRRTIKISRKNRHLSLQRLALNTIFKHLK